MGARPSSTTSSAPTRLRPSSRAGGHHARYDAAPGREPRARARPRPGVAPGPRRLEGTSAILLVVAAEHHHALTDLAASPQRVGDALPRVKAARQRCATALPRFTAGSYRCAAAPTRFEAAPTRFGAALPRTFAYLPRVFAAPAPFGTALPHIAAAPTRFAAALTRDEEGARTRSDKTKPVVISTSKDRLERP